MITFCCKSHWSFIIPSKLILLLIQIVFGFFFPGYIFYYINDVTRKSDIKNLLDITKILHQTFHCCTLGDLFEVVLSSYIRILKYGLILFLCIWYLCPKAGNPFVVEQQFRYFVFLSCFPRYIVVETSLGKVKYVFFTVSECYDRVECISIKCISESVLKVIEIRTSLSFLHLGMNFHFPVPYTP